MKIKKFTKAKNNLYKLTLEDDRTILVHEELILKKGMLLSKEIDQDTINDIERLNNNLNAYDIAIKYISNRYHSIHEVRNFLRKKEIDNDVIEEVISKMIKQKYLDDKVYTKAYINDQINLTNNGPYKIRRELENVYVKDSIIDEYLSAFDLEKEKEKLEVLIPKYVKTIRNKSYSMMKKKVVDHFTDSGYSKSIIISLLDTIEYEDNNIYEKEYEKIKNKLSRKYSGEELEFKIKQSLYQKGFRQ